MVYGSDAWCRKENEMGIYEGQGVRLWEPYWECSSKIENE